MVPTQIDATVRGKLESSREGAIVLAVDHSEYRLELAPHGPIRAPIGKRVRGTIEARSLRMFRAAAGGRFIEPIYGPPRIVQGAVVSVDQLNHRVLLDTGVPMWVTAPPEQNVADLNPGELVNFYVQSGTSFVPAA